MKTGYGIQISMSSLVNPLMVSLSSTTNGLNSDCSVRGSILITTWFVLFDEGVSETASDDDDEYGGWDDSNHGDVVLWRYPYYEVVVML